MESGRGRNANKKLKKEYLASSFFSFEILVLTFLQRLSAAAVCLGEATSNINLKQKRSSTVLSVDTLLECANVQGVKVLECANVRYVNIREAATQKKNTITDTQCMYRT